MVSSVTSQQILKKLQDDKSNLYCFDCLSSKVTHVSVSHGSMICESCAFEHQSLGSTISYVKGLNDVWSIRHLKIMTAGGNSSLKNFFTSIRMPESASIEYKYCTVAAKYYREMLKIIAEGETCTVPSPSPSEALNLVTDPNEYGENLVKDDEEIKQNGKNFTGVISNAFSSTLNVGKNLYGKVKEIETYKKIEDHAINAVSKVGEGIKWSAQKGKEHIEKGVEWGANKGKEHFERGAHLGVGLIKSGAIGAYDHVSLTASNTINKLQIGEKVNNIKKETMNLINNIEKNTFKRAKNNQNNEVIDEEDEEPSEYRPATPPDLN